VRSGGYLRHSEPLGELPGNRYYGFRCPSGAMACSEGVAASDTAYPPHPYFGRKFLVFNSLQAWLRCKIVKTKELPAESSRIRSYGTFRPLLAAPGWKTALKRPCRNDDLRATSGFIVQRQRVIIRKHLRCGQRLALRSHVVRGISGPKIRLLRLRSGQALGQPLCTKF